MADLKISALPASTTPLAGTEVLPIVQSSATKQVTVANLTIGRTQTSNGIVQGTAATGYNFTANTPAAGMTSQLLNWYEAGTWTPTYESAVGSFTSITYAINTAGTYVRKGQEVTVSGAIRTDAITVGTASGAVYISGLPFVISAGIQRASGSIGFSSDFVLNNPSTCLSLESTTSIRMLYRTTANGVSSVIQVTDLLTTVATNFVFFTITYQTN